MATGEAGGWLQWRANGKKTTDKTSLRDTLRLEALINSDATYKLLRIASDVKMAYYVRQQLNDREQYASLCRN